jgi:hypothetical protein
MANSWFRIPRLERLVKEAADRVGKPIYLELSSINPIYILPGAIRERGAAIAEQFASSCLMGVGQFCTNPGLIVLKAGTETEDWIRQVGERFSAAPVGTLLGPSVQSHLERRRHGLLLPKHLAARHRVTVYFVARGLADRDVRQCFTDCGR